MPGGIRTPDPRIRSPMLYPTELLAHIQAGDGNRTHIASLEGQNSTIELHPQNMPKTKKDGRGGGTRTPDPMVPNHVRYQTALHPVDQHHSFPGLVCVQVTVSATNFILADFHSFGKSFFSYFFTFFPRAGSSVISNRPQLGD